LGRRQDPLSRPCDTLSNPIWHRTKIARMRLKRS